MFKKDWRSQILTVPNLLSLFRLILIPVYIRIYLRARTPAQFYTAGAILVVSCLTDAIDGKIARKYNMVTTLGKILDPLADKITQFTLTLCLRIRYPVLRPVLALFVVKELFQLMLGIMNLMQGRILPGALMTGKVCTTVLFISLILLVLLPQLPSPIVSAVALVDSVFLMVSFVSYLFAYLGKHPLVQDLKHME